MLKVTIGIPVFGNTRYVSHLLALVDLIRCNGRVAIEIIVVDDGSNSEVRERLEAVCKAFHAKLVLHERNKGVPASWNSIVKHADSDVVFVSNDDVLIESLDLISDLTETLLANETIGIIAPCEQSIDFLGIPGSRNFGASSEPYSHAWPSGSFFALKKNLWEKVTNPDGSIGFWESLRLYGEEWDFGYSLAQMGYLTCVLRCHNYLHYGGQSTGIARQKLYRKAEYFNLELAELQEKLSVGPTPIEQASLTVPQRIRRRLFGSEELVSRSMLSRKALALRHGDDRFLTSPHDVACDAVQGLDVALRVCDHGQWRDVVPLPVPR